MAAGFRVRCPLLVWPTLLIDASTDKKIVDMHVICTFLHVIRGFFAAFWVSASGFIL